MLQSRIIPILLLQDERLVKTRQFKHPEYIGDPTNTIRIFNELEVDELIILDIEASKTGMDPNYSLLLQISSECFMPLAYGGAIRSLNQATKIFDIGFEKISLNSYAFQDESLVKSLAKNFGNQAIIGSIDIKWNNGNYEVYSFGGRKKENCTAIERAKELQSLGVGELLITSIDREGTWNGYDISLINEIAEQVTIPVIANGGAGTVKHLSDVFTTGRASAAGLGSMVVYYRKDQGVLINMPNRCKVS